MLQAISVARLVEELAYEHSSTRNASGSFKSVADLAKDADLLARDHKGLFAYLAFHPTQDSAVRQYIEAQSVCDDAGKTIMVLTMAAQACGFAEDVNRDLLIGTTTVRYARHPAYELAEWMFPGGHRPLLPALLIFDRVFDVCDSVYVPLADSDNAKEVGARCREVFLIIEEAFAKDQVAWLDRAAAQLKRAKIPYERTGDKSFREWLVKGLEISSKTGLSLVVLIPKLVSKLLGL